MLQHLAAHLVMHRSSTVLALNVDFVSIADIRFDSSDRYEAIVTSREVIVTRAHASGLRPSEKPVEALRGKSRQIEKLPALIE